MCIVLGTKPLVFASLTSDRRQIVVGVCQHPASPVQCKQPQVIMQTVESDHTAAGRSAVCLSDRLVQSAPVLQIKLWRLGHEEVRCKSKNEIHLRFKILNIRHQKNIQTLAVRKHLEPAECCINVSLMILY